MARKGRKAKFIITAEMHEEIHNVYLTMTGNGEVRRLAQRLGIPRWKVSRYALHQGWCAKAKKEPNWSEKELKVLERNSHLTIERIQLKLKERGFHRSLCGIFLKRKRMRFLGNLSGISASSLAQCFGIDSHSIIKWIERGLLKAKRRELNSIRPQSGDPYLIKYKWIKDFIVENVAIIDFRKVDKYWLIDLLTGKDYQ